MGYEPQFNTSAYEASAAFRKTSGTPDFGYSATMASTPRSAQKVAPLLDPMNVVREARDSANHPCSRPIGVIFDVTGSMRLVPEVLQAKLPDLFGLLQRKGYIEDPQIMFGAVGDADKGSYWGADKAPLQIGQFETSVAADEQLRSIFLEGGGGGQQTESYQLAAYFMARHVVTDAWEKRGEKGYLFIIGDEMNKKFVDPEQVAEHIGDTLEAPIPTEDIWAEVKKRWHVYFILPNQTSYYDDPVIEKHWRKIVGQNFVKLDDPAGVSELIALIIGMAEETIDLDDGLDDLKEIGSGAGGAVGKALVAAGVGGRGGRAVTTRLPDDFGGADDLA